MKACILSIGDELLIGQTINTNAAWMGEQLSLIGIDAVQTLVISDKETEILRGLDEAGRVADVVLITGGLGPTKDDITKHTLCKYFNTHLVMNEKVLEKLVEYFTKRGRVMLDVNRMQAEIPAACEMLPNNYGTAQGMWFNQNGKIYISMPGVPYEMKGIMQEFALPKLAALTESKIVHRTLLTTGMGESYVAEKIADIESDLHAQNLGLAYLPSPGIVKLRITAKGKQTQQLQHVVDAFATRIIARVGEIYFGEGNTTLEQLIADTLKAKGKTLSTVESCTGGNVGRMLTGVPGASDFYMGSVTAYAYSAKENVLSLDHETLVREGAVSEWCALNLAINGRKLMRTDYCISTTGIAGPTGGTSEKPVGTVWIGFASAHTAFAKKFTYGDNRAVNIQLFSAAALNMLRLALHEAK